MSTPKSNGLFEVAGAKQPKEQGFFCARLMAYINQEPVPRYTPEYRKLWEDSFGKAKSGRCPYRDRCPIYERTIAKQRQKQPQLEFDF